MQAEGSKSGVIAPAPPGRASASREEELTITAEEFGALAELIHRQTGIFLRETKRGLVLTRLSRRLRAHGLRSFAEYHAYLTDRDPAGEELRQMINCITTNKTEFFREAHHFDFLREHLLPRLRERAKRGGSRKIRIWSAGCSSGEEPYSIAMTVQESLGSLAGWDVRILASDIDTEILGKAQAGIYPAERLESVPEAMHGRTFLRGRGSWEGSVQVRPELQQLIAFRRINLVDEPWPVHARFDAIFCRNVIIYFDSRTQRRLLERFAGYLAEDGYLFLGHSENLFWMNDFFVPLRNTIYRLQRARAPR